MGRDNIDDFFHRPNHHDYRKSIIYIFSFFFSIFIYMDVVCGPGVVPNRIPPSFETGEVDLSRS